MSEPVPLTSEQKAQWVTALRSGKYIQGSAYLKNRLPGDDEGFSYCCLGVLQDLLGKESCPQLNDTSEYLSGTIIPLRIQEKLGGMNDGRLGFQQRSFLEIADWIEKNL